MAQQTPVAVVTGASRGAGRGIARALGAHGCIVYVTGRSQREGDASLPGTIHATAEEVGQEPPRLALGRHSSARGLRHELERLRLHLPAEWHALLLEEVRRFAVQRQTALSDADLRQLVKELRESHGIRDL